MIRLRQSFGAHAGRVLEFDGPRIRFGRLPDNDVVFDARADLDASGRHAEILRKGSAYVVRDLGSRNGTFIDGERVEHVVLRGGEEIEFGSGGPRFRVELAGSASTPGGAGPTSARFAPPDIEPQIFLRLSIGVLIVGVIIATMAIAVLLAPDD